MMLRTGVFLQDRYEILEQIGSGGMSAVYKAKCHKLNRLVAIKVLKEEFCADKSFVARFKMEAQSVAGLSHPNVVRVYDVVDEGDLHYIVMELIEGVTIKNYISKKGKLDSKECIAIGIQVAQGIAAAHEQHIIHRDIKPQNIILAKDGKVKVADFGIARAVSAQTMSSAAMGSVHYISPEQARGNYSDERSDIYSLGITMYEMVTGTLPFEGDNTVTVALAHLKDPIIPPSVYAPDITLSLEQIILKCTQKKPENRYQNVEQVIKDLRTALVNPSGDFVESASSAGSLGQTVIINDQELQEIKNQTPELEQRRRPAQSRQTGSDKPDDVDPHIEKMLAGAGIIIAILIVAVLIFIFSQLTGIFGGGLGRETSGGAGTGVETQILKDTEVFMPYVEGMTEELAEQTLKDSNLSMKRTYAESDNVPQGSIISQTPEAGTIVPRYSSVDVVISNGSDKIDLTVMSLEELDMDTAKITLESRNLTIAIVEEENETVPAGMVVRYSPDRVNEGETVTLYVSTGPHVDLIPIPNLVGQTEEDAVALLAESGLLPGSATTENSDTVPVGQVISQSGGENGMIEPGGTVSYVVSLGPETSTQRYVASIRETYDLSSLVGPGAGRATVTITIRLHQVVNGEDVYRTLTQAKTITGNVMLPINYTGIESEPGVDEGEVEVVDVTTGAVLKSYPLIFFPMD